MVNRVFLLGRLGKDPEVRYLDNQRVVANFTLATNEVYIDKNGNKVDQTEWHNVELWDGLARNAEKVLKKGRIVFIEGKIKSESWVDKEGNKRYTTRIRGNQFQVVGSNNNEQNNQNERPAAPQNDMAQNSEDPFAPVSEPDDILPF